MGSECDPANYNRFMDMHRGTENSRTPRRLIAGIWLLLLAQAVDVAAQAPVDASPQEAASPRTDRVASPRAERAQRRHEHRLQWLAEREAAGLPRPPRMSPEERRELRREIHDAGREVYHRRRPGGGQAGALD